MILRWDALLTKLSFGGAVMLACARGCDFSVPPESPMDHSSMDAL